MKILKLKYNLNSCYCFMYYYNLTKGSIIQRIYLKKYNLKLKII